MVIDSIPWGPSGAATAKGRNVPTQRRGGGGSTTGGSTGGGGGRSGRPSGDSGGEEGKDKGMSAWQQWWARLLLAGGGVSSVFLLSSRVREALQNAVASVKAQFTTGMYWLVDGCYFMQGRSCLITHACASNLSSTSDHCLVLCLCLLVYGDHTVCLHKGIALCCECSRLGI